MVVQGICTYLMTALMTILPPMERLCMLSRAVGRSVADFMLSHLFTYLLIIYYIIYIIHLSTYLHLTMFTCAFKPSCLIAYDL